MRNKLIRGTRVLLMLAAFAALPAAAEPSAVGSGEAPAPSTKIAEAELPLKLPAGTATRPVQFTKIIFDLQPGQEFGRVKAGWLCVPQDNLKWSDDIVSAKLGWFSLAFSKVFSGLGFKVADAGKDLFATGDGAGGAEFELGAVVKSIEADICAPNAGFGNLRDLKGSVAMEVDWQLYSRRDRQVVARYSSRAVYKIVSGEAGDVFDTIVMAFVHNLGELAKSWTLHAHLVGSPSAGLGDGTPRAPSKGLSPIVVHLPPVPVKRLPDAVGATVLVQTSNGHGSGFLVSSDGYFLTNHHVVGSEKYVKLRWSDGVEGLGEVVRIDRGRDVALIKADSRGRAPLKLRASRPPVGTSLFAIGAPLEEKLQNTVTRGIISATRIEDGYTLLQSDVMIQPGNSGGPVVDENAELVGISVSGLEVDGVPRGINFLIPAAEAYDFLGLKVMP